MTTPEQSQHHQLQTAIPNAEIHRSKPQGEQHVTKTGLTRMRTPTAYTPAGFYILNAPVLPASMFLHLLTAQVADALVDTSELPMRLEEIQALTRSATDRFIEDYLIVFALNTANPILGKKIIKLLETSQVLSQGKWERVYTTLLRYLVRMCTRPTPFGAFAGVASGTFTSQTTVQFNLPIIAQTRVRINHDWHTALVQKIEQHPKLFRHMFLHRNPNLHLTDTLAVLASADIYHEGDTTPTTLRATSVLRYVLEMARKPYPYSWFQAQLQLDFPEAQRKHIDKLLHQLWQHHFLISDLRPPITTANPLQYLHEHSHSRLGILKDYPSLNNIQQLVLTIENQGTRTPPTLLHRLFDLQRALVPTHPHPFRVDTRLDLSATGLHRHVGQALAEIVDLCLTMNRHITPRPHLDAYRAAFLARYGTASEIPLLELLDPIKGLDAPPTYTEPARAFPLAYDERPTRPAHDAFLQQLLSHTLLHGGQELVLTAYDMRQIMAMSGPRPVTLPATLEVCVQIQARSRAAIDRGHWRAVFSSSEMTRDGAPFYCFYDLFDTQTQQRIGQYARHAQSLNPDLLYAELSFLPARPHADHIAPRPLLHTHEIVLNTPPSLPSEQVIPLNDLVVGVRDGRFYIRSLRFNKEVVATQSQLFDLRHAPNICRFLLEVAQEGQPALTIFDWGSAASATFLPRVVYKQVVLSPAQWRVPARLIPRDNTNETVSFQLIQAWCETWHIPRYVYLHTPTNRLLLDLEHPHSVADLAQALLALPTGGELCLQEMLPSFSDLWLDDTIHRPYIADFIVPLQLAQPPSPSSPASTTQDTTHTDRLPGRLPIKSHERRQLPGSAWTCLELFAPSASHTEFLAEPLRSFTHHLNAQQSIDRWFFTRHHEPSPHLSVCFHARNSHEDEVLLSTIHWARELVGHNFIHSMNLTPYERPIERFGGPTLIDVVETVFTASSAIACELARDLFTGKFTLDTVTLGVLALNNFYTLCGIDFAQRLQYAREYTSPQAYRSAFHPRRHQLCALLSKSGGRLPKAIQLQSLTLASLCSLQEPTLISIMQYLRTTDRRGDLWQSEQTILAALAHEHLNRLFALDPEQEHKIYAFWRHTLESIARRHAVRNHAHRKG